MGRAGWRTFRVDRMALRTPAGPRFTPRTEPPADLVPRGIDAALSRLRALVTVHAPAAEIAAKVPPTVLVEPVDGPPELLDALRTIGGRVGRTTENGAK